MISIGIIEDNKELMSNYCEYFDLQKDFSVVFRFPDVETFLVQYKHETPVDIVLLDINLPGMTGVESIHLIRKMIPAAKIIMLTAYLEEEQITGSLTEGASGYLVKTNTLSFIGESIRDTMKGGNAVSPEAISKLVAYFNNKSVSVIRSLLSPREFEIALLVTEGLSYKEVAQRLNISAQTVNQHLKKIYTKTNVNSKTELASRILKK
jgi:DNA-binding NarL/FixJ family response regulator